LPFDGPCYRETLAAFYATCADRLRGLAETGEDVVVLCEGDPFFYGSFMHLHARLAGVVPVRVVPGITGMSGAWTATGLPVTWGDDVLTVLPGTLPEEELARRMDGSDAVVVMKLGRTLDRVRRALRAAGRDDAAWLVECATMPGERVTRLSEAKGAVPYFSLIVVHGQGRRP
jgi:precorrin-2/cobalt-factor-2 C20-methyltransferase